ncbi:MAG: hypothetical protein RLZ62_2134, partial [Bacteroidota bacterium]
EGDILTGLIYIDTESKDLHHLLNTAEQPLNQLGKDKLCPGMTVLDKINASLR